MNRRPYPYESSYYYPPPYQGHYYNGPKSQHTHNPYITYQQPNIAQTPFDQFAKPSQPANWPNFTQQNGGYPQQNPSQQTNKGLLTQFQDNNGQVDLDKMLSTVGQLANTVQQVSPVIKQVGSIMKNFR